MNELSSAFDRKKTRHTFTVLGLGLLGFFGLSTLIMDILPMAVPKFGMLLESMDHTTLNLIYYVLLYGVGFLLFVLLVKGLPKDELPKQKLSLGRLIIIVAMAYPLCIAGNITGTVAEYLINPANTTILNMNKFFSMDSVLPEVVAVLVAPVVEELVFRKMLIDRTKRFGEKTAILVSAVCFGLYHRTIPQFLYATVLGCFFGYVYSRSGKIHYTMIMHACLNGYSAILMLLMSGYMKLSQAGEATLASTSSLIIVLLMLQMELLMFGFIILGIVFLCKWLKKVRFVDEGPYCIPKKERFGTVCLSAGLIIFAAVCVGLTFATLLAGGDAALSEQLLNGEWL